MAVCSILIHLSVTGVAEIAKYTNLMGCPHTLYIRYIFEERSTLLLLAGYKIGYSIHNELAGKFTW